MDIIDKLVQFAQGNKSITGKFASMNFTKRYHWRVSLELKLRKCSGDSFQQFFSDIMDKVHKNDFVRVRAFGSLGDKGCDGYLQSSGQVYQCYGALNAAKNKVAYLTKKMNDDYTSASKDLSTIMKEWHMVHNIVDGLPIHAIETLEGLKAANPTHAFGFLGMEGLEERIFSLSENDIEALLGPAATEDDEKNLQPLELQELIKAIVVATDNPTYDTKIGPVPADKLEFNQLPNHWHSLIAGGWQNAHLVGYYFSQHPDPLMGEKIARSFHDKYCYLKNQGLPPGSIMTYLYESISGKMSSSPARQVVAQALLAHLFESCDIFEDTPNKVVI